MNAFTVIWDNSTNQLSIGWMDTLVLLSEFDAIDLLWALEQDAEKDAIETWLTDNVIAYFTNKQAAELRGFIEMAFSSPDADPDDLVLEIEEDIRHRKRMARR